MNAQPILELQSARVSIQNVEVLRQFSLRIEAGQMVGLIGRNGTGKSSLLAYLAGETAAPILFGLSAAVMAARSTDCGRTSCANS